MIFSSSIVHLIMGKECKISPRTDLSGTEIKNTLILTRDQLIIPGEQIPQKVLDVIAKAEEAGFGGMFEALHLSGITLSQELQVEGWTKKPNSWYWKQLAEGTIGKDAAKLPDSWVLIDRTRRPVYYNGKQLYRSDPLGSFLKELRQGRKIERAKNVPDTSRFEILDDALVSVVLPALAEILDEESSAVRLLSVAEFNIIGNLEHPEWGAVNTSEFFKDLLGECPLFGGNSELGGLTNVGYLWPDLHPNNVAFRPLVVVPTN